MSKNTIPFDKYVQPDYYATNTLINGNISDCITYLKGLYDYGRNGMHVIHLELTHIKEECPERYEYVKDKVFSQ